MKLRVERDVLADSVAWAARTLPSRPSLPVLAGLVLTATERRTDPQQLRLRGLGSRGDRRRRRDRGHVPGVGPTPRRHRPIAAAGSGHHRERGHPHLDHLRPLVVHAARPCRSRTTRSCRSCRRRPAPSRARPSPPPSARWPSRPVATTPCRPSPASAWRSRGRRSSSRPPTATASPCASSPGTRSRRRCRRTRSSRPAPSPTRRNPLPTLTKSSSRCPPAAPARGSSASRVTAVARRPDCSTASSRSTARCCPSESAAVANVETAMLIDAVKRVALVAERNTPVRLAFEGSELTLRAGAGDDAQAVEVLESALDGDAIDIAFNPAYLLDGLAAVGSAVDAVLVHPGHPAGGPHRRRRRPEVTRRLQVPADARPTHRLSRVWVDGSTADGLPVVRAG